MWSHSGAISIRSISAPLDCLFTYLPLDSHLDRSREVFTSANIVDPVHRPLNIIHFTMSRSTRPSLPLLALTSLIALTLVSAAPKYDDIPCPDPYVRPSPPLPPASPELTDVEQADPATDTCNPIRYIPIKSVNIVAVVIYFIVAIILTYRASLSHSFS